MAARQAPPISPNPQFRVDSTHQPAWRLNPAWSAIGFILVSRRRWVILNSPNLMVSALFAQRRRSLPIRFEARSPESPVIATIALTVADRRFWITKIKIAILAAATFAALC